MKEPRSLPYRRHVVAVLGVVAAAVLPLLPTETEARPQRGVDDHRSTEQQRRAVRVRHGQVKLEVNALQAKTSELNAALATLTNNVAKQKAQLEEAQRVAAEAQKDLAEASAAVVEAQQRIDELDAASRRFVVDAFTSPPTESAFDALDAPSFAEATVKRALLDIYADSHSDVFDQLTAAHEDVEVERQNKASIAAEAQQKQQAADAALARVRAAQAQQQDFLDDAEAALERKLAESAQLADVDRQLSEKIAREQAELARRLAAQRAAAEAAAARRNGSGNGGSTSGAGGGGGGAGGGSWGPGTIKAVPGGLARVSCSSGSGITVAGTLGPRLRRLLDAAARVGVTLCGWGYRSAQQQINLRRAHCGGSNYSIWHKPAGLCSPPTARPGFSMHETGQAVDFYCDGGASIESHRNRCYKWLARNAAGFGLYNLPSEPWHWSTNGH